MTISRDVIQRLLNVVNDTRRRLNTVESREYVLLTAVQTLTNKTLTTPTISNFTNATHDHEDAAGGGQLSLTAAVTGVLPPSNGGTGVNNATRTLTINTNSGTLAFGAASKTITINESLNLSGASGKTLTLTNSLTVQGGGDTVLSSAGNYTLTIPATGTAALLGTANVFTESQNISKSQNTVTRLTIENTNAGTSAFADLLVTTGAGQGFAVQKFGSGSTAAWSGISINNWARFRSDTGVDGLIFTTGGAKPLIFGTSDTERLRIISNGNVGIGVTSPTARLHVEQASASGGQPTLRLRQAHLSEEFIRFDTTVGTGNPINTTSLGAYYGRVRVHVQGVGAKWLALYD